MPPTATTGPLAFRRHGRQPIPWPPLSPRAFDSSTRGGGLCRPLTRYRCRDQSRRHGVSDPAARAANGPARVRRGRSRHGWRCLCRSCERLCSVLGNRRESGTHSRAEPSVDLPDNPVPLVREILVTKSHSFRARSRDRSGVRREHDRCTLVGTHQNNEVHLIGGADHHAFNAGSVLGIVQGSSLRSARAYARPSGLDDACAQIGLGDYVMVGGVMTRSWTDLGR